MKQCAKVSSKNIESDIPIQEIRIKNYTKVLSKKWIINILHVLQTSNKTFSELATELQISNQELSKKLKLLKSFNLVKKTPAFMEEKELSVYESTLIEKDLTDLIQKLGNFGKKYMYSN